MEQDEDDSGQAGMISWASLLLLSLTVSTFATASGLHVRQSVVYQHKQLKDVKRLQAGYWLKVRNKAQHAHMMVGLSPVPPVYSSVIVDQ